jgi:rhodanese-related sulfurtransferase
MRMAWKTTKVPSISVREAAALVLTGEIQLVDVRDPRELAEARVAGATNIPLGELSRRLGELDLSRQVAFLCRSGNRSMLAASAARRSGIDAANVHGGVVAWAEAGLPFAKDDQ